MSASNSPPPRCQRPDGTAAFDVPPPLALLPGSFDPLHGGHVALAGVAAERLGCAVHFEMSVTNAEKPELADDEVARRLTQFAGVAHVWVTRAWAFRAKADLFPGATFVLGHDTAVRLVDPRFYGGDPGRRDAALRHFRERGCRVLIGGRRDESGAFRVWDGAGLDGDFAALFVPLTEADFRADVSSTDLRRAARAGTCGSGDGAHPSPVRAEGDQAG